jgi:predicted nucleic acid-binding protein
VGPGRSGGHEGGLGLRARYLADKSAYTAERESGRRRLAALIAAREVATCGVTELEILFGARGGRDYARISEERRQGLDRAPVDQGVVGRALDVQAELAQRGLHRAVGAADLLIAAAAELAGLTLLHCDRDFDQVRAVTGQRMALLARPSAARREQPFVILTGRADTFVVRAVVDAFGPEMALEKASDAGLAMEDGMQAVAVPQRHWRPQPGA